MNYNSGKKKEKASKLIVEELFPDDIMANLGKNMHDLNIGEYTKYLIGWNNEEKDYFKNMVSERKVVVK